MLLVGCAAAMACRYWLHLALYYCLSQMSCLFLYSTVKYYIVIRKLDLNVTIWRIEICFLGKMDKEILVEKGEKGRLF